MSKKNTKLLFSEISPFSTVVQEILNTPSFLDRALIQLDNYLNDKNYTFLAEDVLLIIANENWALDDMEINLTPNNIDDKYTRLKRAVKNEAFQDAFRESKNSYGLEWTLPLHLTLFTNENNYMLFSLLEINDRIKNNFELKHTEALSLVAATFGFDNANDISRFDYYFKQALINWTVIGLRTIPSKSFFEHIKSLLDNRLSFGVSVRDQIKTNSPIAYNISFNDLAVTKHIVPEMIKLIEKHEFTHQWARLSNLSAEKIPDIFYRQLAQLLWGVKFTPSRVQELVCCNILMQNIVQSCVGAYSLAYGSDVFPSKPELGITSEELQYRWLESMFKHDHIMLDESKKTALENLQKVIGNTFVDFRLPWPLNMLENFDGLFSD